MLKKNRIFRQTGSDPVCRTDINLLIILVIVLSCLVQANMAAADDCEVAQTWYDRGLDLMDNSDKEALYYKRAIELCPGFAEAHNRLGEVYKSRGEYDIAAKEFEEASRTLLYAEPHNNLGDIYRMLGKYDLAEKEFITAVRINPDSLDAQNQLKYIRKRLGMYDYAFEDHLDRIPISIFTRMPGMTLPKGSFLVDFQYNYWKQESDLTEELFAGDEVPSLAYAPSKRETTVHAWIFGIRYGLTNNLTIGLIPKFFRKKAHIRIEQAGIEAENYVTGPGDTFLPTKYYLWGRRETYQSSIQAARARMGQPEIEIGAERYLTQKEAQVPIEQAGIDADPYVTGLGDTIFLTKYHLWGRRKTHISGFMLVNIPTGDEDAEGKDGKFSCRIPLGSGSFHFTPGIAFTWVEESLVINGDISYMITDGNQAADEFKCDLAFLFQCFPNLVSSIELNYRWRGSYEMEQTYQTMWGRPPTIGQPFNPLPGGTEYHDAVFIEKGGHTLFVSTGLKLSLPKEFEAELGIKVPVIKPSDETAWIEKTVFHVGLTKYFF